MSDSKKEEILSRELDNEQLETVPGGGCGKSFKPKRVRKYAKIRMMDGVCSATDAWLLQIHTIGDAY